MASDELVPGPTAADASGNSKPSKSISSIEVGDSLRSPASPDLSVVIVNRNTKRLLRCCLQSLDRHSRGLDIEVIVVDNGSTDGSVQMLRDDFPRIRRIENPQNLGYAGPNNQGLALSRGRYVMLLNSDTELTAGALESLVGFMDRNPDFGACGPMLRYPNGEIQRSCFSFHSPGRHLCNMLGLGRLFPGTRLENLNTRFKFDGNASVEWLIGAALLVRRSALEAVGPLDERFRIHCNDADWCYRMTRSGFRIGFVADAVIVHHSGATLKMEMPSGTVELELYRNLFDYHRKHFGLPGLLWLRFWMIVGYGIRAVRDAITGADGSENSRRVRVALMGRL